MPPVAGTIISFYGQDSGFGQSSRGIEYKTRLQARVVAPYDGKIVFAGTFRGHGQVLIIEHTNGYHTVLAGFGRIEAIAGQWVLAGEPVGVMAARENHRGSPRLYVELRKSGQALNPLRWILSDHTKKGQG